MEGQRLAVVLLLAVLAGTAAAQIEDQGGDTQRDGWRFTVGGGVAYSPKYPGADRYSWRAIPVFGVGYGRFFAGGDPGGAGGAGGAGGGIGMNLIRDPAWRLGVALAPGFGRARRESDHPSLEGLGDIDRATRLIAFGGFVQRWYSAALRVATDISGKDQGTLVFFDLNARYRATEKLTLSAGPGVTWADDDYTMTFFGITPEQSARSTLPAYQANGGLHMYRFGVGAGYVFDRHWGMGARLGTARLQGDAVGSPITRDRTQNLFALFVSYRF